MVYIILLVISCLSLIGIVLMMLIKIPTLAALPMLEKTKKTKIEKELEALESCNSNTEVEKNASPWLFEERFREHLKIAKLKMKSLRDRDPHKIDEDSSYWSRIVSSKDKKKKGK